MLRFTARTNRSTAGIAHAVKAVMRKGLSADVQVRAAVAALRSPMSGTSICGNTRLRIAAAACNFLPNSMRRTNDDAHGGMARSAFGSMRSCHNCFIAGSGSTSALAGQCRYFTSPAGVARPSGALCSPKRSNELQGYHELDHFREEKKEEQHEEEAPSGESGPGYLPFPPPFHTINIVMILFIANVLCYLIMNGGSDDMRDFIVEHFTLSHENWRRIYPLFTNAFYQENLLQLLIDCWLLWQFGETMLGFLGNTRMAFLAMLCTLGGSLIHLARQKFELHYGMDPLEVRGCCYGPNPFIMGLISMEGLIFRHLNFIQHPPIPFLVLTAFVMVIDVWRIFTTRPEEHGAATGGALMAYVFWALPTRCLGLDKLTATL